MRVPSSGVVLGVAADGYRARSLPVEEVGEGLVEIVLEPEPGRPCHVRVELADPGRADAFALVDAVGQPLLLARLRGGGEVRSAASAALVAGSSAVLVAEAGDYELVLSLAGREVERTRVTLVEGEVSVVRR